ncbi:putative transcriptional regulator love [Triangularia verruculosa]|uniref:Transcriptional regulator love n=1 Tax=Triangularia verruculosa TaxID=2587418 RepID=A0AAN7AVT8_9PEZI|nr:putative transcriptional regulator love [Triangularia verruculosa]
MTPNQTHQSIRSSCDRCRSQKLKCTISPEMGSGGSTSSERESHRPCQRCSKARVPCVFSRRLRTVKERSRSATGPTSCPVTQQEAHAAPKSAAEDVASSTQHDSLRRAYSWTNSPTPSFPDLATPEPIDHGDHGLDDLSFGYGPDGYLSDMAIFSADLSLITPAPTSSPGPTTETDQQTTFWTPPFPVFLNSTAGAEKPQMLQRLLNLVVELQEGFRLLESHSWLQEDSTSSNSLDSYPIGTILHLSKEFAKIVKTAQEQISDLAAPSPSVESEGFHFAVSTSPVLGRDSSILNSDDLSTSTPQGVLDTPTRLLILTSYVSLTRLYTTMLGHFQKHLSLLPSPSSVPEIEMDEWRAGPEKRCLNLGELPPSTDVAHCSRIHTAVRLLLGSLERVEAVIEVPVGLRSTSGCSSTSNNPAWMGSDCWEGLEKGRAVTPTEWENELDICGVGLEQIGTGTGVQATGNKANKGSSFFPLLRQEAMICAGGLQEGFAELSSRAASVKELLREKMGL